MVAGLINHGDADSEYLSIRYGAELAAAGIAPSVGTAGDPYDNALAQRIIGLYKTEVIDHLGPWETPPGWRQPPLNGPDGITPGG